MIEINQNIGMKWFIKREVLVFQSLESVAKNETGWSNTCIEELAWFIVKIYCLFLLREFNFVFIQFAFLGGTYLKQMKMKVCF